MADGSTGIHISQLKPVYVPEYMINGSKFIKWDEQSAIGQPVTLKVDPLGFFLYWIDQSKEVDLIDMLHIRDVRNGKSAKIPKDSKLRESCQIGGDTSLADKTITVCKGTDCVNISLINFVSNSDVQAKDWSGKLFDISTCLLAPTGNVGRFMEKQYVKTKILTASDGKIPVKNLVKMITTGSKAERKKVEHALSQAGIHPGKNNRIDQKHFTYEKFIEFCLHVTKRHHDLDKIFEEVGAKKKPFITQTQLLTFVNTTQQDPRLNELLYPRKTLEQANEIINKYEPNHSMSSKGRLSAQGLMSYLISEDNIVIGIEKFDMYQDMDQPLSHYFINTSHNSYLTGHQLTGKSSVEMYRQCLLSGCRCLELDCWDGRTSDEEPIITHGYTMCTEILFKDVIEAIAESVFKNNDFPVILSFENHCTKTQQVKMAQYLTQILGDMILTQPLESNPLLPGYPLPSPADLRGKILVKNRIRKHLHQGKHTDGDRKQSLQSIDSTLTQHISDNNTNTHDHKDIKPITHHKDSEQKTDYRRCQHDSDGSDDEDISITIGENTQNFKQDKIHNQNSDQTGTAADEVEAGAEMSALVNYITPHGFHGFDYAEKRNIPYEISSLVESQATMLLKAYPVDFVNYNKRQTSRIYPKGTRVDSSNFLPQIYWNAGCQFVALNFQTLDFPMQLNQGFFEYNGKRGYILKPIFLRRNDRMFDPFTESTVDGIVAGKVSVTVISGQFLTDRKIGTYVEVDMYGIPADTVRKRFKTKTVLSNGIHPVYDDVPFVFKRVILPGLASLRFAVNDESGKMVGHRILPVQELRPGYRHIPLRNEFNIPINMASLFVHITVGDYIPENFADFAEALANPIAYISSVDKHEEQLKSLLDEEDHTNNTTHPDGEFLARSHELAVVSSTTVDTGESREDMMWKSTTSIDDGVGGGHISTWQPSQQARFRTQSIVSALSVDQTFMKWKQASSTLSLPNHLSTGSLQQLQNLRDIRSVSAADLLHKQDTSWRHARPYLIMKMKHEKKFQKITRKQTQLAIELRAMQEKEIRKLEKCSHKDVRKMMKFLRRPSDQLDGDLGTEPEGGFPINSVMSDLSRQQEQKMISLCKIHRNQYKAFRNQQLQTELEIRGHQINKGFDYLNKVMMERQQTDLFELEQKSVQDIHNLRKQLAIETRFEIKRISSQKRKDQHELSSLKQEIRQKNIQQAVSSTQRLNEFQQFKRRALEHYHEETASKLETEKQEALFSLNEQYKRRLDYIDVEFEQAVYENTTPQHTHNPLSIRSRFSRKTRSKGYNMNL